MSDDDTWIDIVLNSHGDYCKNCNTWRELQNGLYLEQCPNCDDDQIDIYEADAKAEQLP